VSACVQRGGGRLIQTFFGRAVPQIFVCEPNRSAIFFSAEACHQLSAEACSRFSWEPCPETRMIKNDILHWTLHYLIEPGDHLALGCLWAFPQGSVVGRLWLASGLVNITTDCDGVSRMSRCIRNTGLEPSIVRTSVVHTVGNTTEVSDERSLANLMAEHLCVVFKDGSATDKGVLRKTGPTTRTRKTGKRKAMDLELESIGVKDWSCPKPLMSRQSSFTPLEASQDNAERASFLWPVAPPIVRHGSQLGMSSFSEFQSKYELLGKLGQGSNASVFRARDTASSIMDDQLALKICRRCDAVQEGWFQAFCEHTNVVPVLSGFMAPHYTVLVMPMADTTLFRYVQCYEQGGVSPPHPPVPPSEGGLPAHVVLQLGMQAAAGLAHIHKQGVVHNDIHTGNLLLFGARSADNENLQVKWADFGRACWTSDCGNLGFRPSELFNLNFRPPELLFGGGAHLIQKGDKWHYVHGSGRARPSEASDVWAFACILMYMTKACMPFRTVAPFHDEVLQQIVSVVSVLGRPQPELIRSLGWSKMFDSLEFSIKLVGRLHWPALAAVNEVIGRMLVFDPKQRLPAAQVHERLSTMEAVSP